MTYQAPTITQVTYPNPAFAMTARSRSSVTLAIVHHTAGPLAQTPLEIDQEHRNIGDSMIAYNNLIDEHGTIYSGRPYDYDSAAAFGENEDSVDVCLIGNFQPNDAGYTGPPSDAALQALTQYLIWLHLQFPSISRTIGHRDIAPLYYPDDEGDYSTACPGENLYDKLPSIRQTVFAALGHR
jgi:N-acetylmuramoyl-L-alanine amidase